MKAKFPFKAFGVPSGDLLKLASPPGTCGGLLAALIGASAARVARRRFSFVLVVLAGFPVEAGAFTLLTVNENAWSTDEVLVDFNPTGCPAGLEFPADIEGGIELTWNAVPYSRLRLRKGVTTTEVAAPNGRILVTCAALGSTSAGVTGVSTSGGSIVSALVQLNTATNWTAFSKTTVQLIIAHELGHAIGFGHSDDNFAVMFFTINSAGLSQDDLDAVSYLYSRSDFNDGAFGCGTLAAGGASGGGGPGTGAFAAFVGMLLLAQLLASRTARWSARPRFFYRS